MGKTEGEQLGTWNWMDKDLRTHNCCGSDGFRMRRRTGNAQAKRLGHDSVGGHWIRDAGGRSSDEVLGEGKWDKQSNENRTGRGEEDWGSDSITREGGQDCSDEESGLNMRILQKGGWELGSHENGSG